MNKLMKAGVIAMMAMAVACVPKVEIPEVQSMQIKVNQSEIAPELRKHMEVGQTMSVFFQGIATPKSFTITSVEKDGLSAIVEGEIPYGLKADTDIDLIYADLSLDSDVSNLSVDTRKVSVKNGKTDDENHILYASGKFNEGNVEAMTLAPLTTYLSLDITPYEGFDPSQLTQINVFSSSFSTLAKANLHAAEGQPVWSMRQNKGMEILLDEDAAKSVTKADNGLHLDIAVIPTEAGKPLDNMNFFLYAGKDMYYAEITEPFELKAGEMTHKTIQMQNKDNSAALIFQRKLEEKNLVTGAVRNMEDVLSLYYSIDFDSDEVTFVTFSKNDRGVLEKHMSRQALLRGYYSFAWKDPVAGVKGFRYDSETDEISLDKVKAEEILTLDANEGAAASFMAGNNCHYEIKFDRMDLQFTRGSMSENLWKAAVAQGSMNTIELNKDRHFAFVTYPNNWTSYMMQYEEVSKDHVRATWTGSFDPNMDIDKAVNAEKIKPITDFFFSENIYVPIIAGTRIFYVFNLKDNEFMKFQPSNQDDMTEVSGTSIEKIIKLRGLQTGVIRRDGEFQAYYTINLDAAKVSTITKEGNDLVRKEHAYTASDKKITWDDAILVDLNGFELDQKNNFVASGSNLYTIDANDGASDEFLNKEAGGHYFIRIDRNARKCTAGDMPAALMDQLIAQGHIANIELNKDWHWDFVLFPNNWSFYNTDAKKVSKDVINFVNKDKVDEKFVPDSGFGSQADIELNQQTITGVLGAFYTENIIVREKIGAKPVYLINKTGDKWMKFDRQ